MDSEKVRFENNQGKELVGLLDTPANVANPPVVTILHSFTGYKELKPLHRIAQTCVENGLAAFRFDFSDCIGESDGKCEDMTLDGQIQDTLAALQWVKKQGKVDGTRIGLAGHSLGGTTAVNAAAKDNGVNALVTVSALARPEWEHLFPDDKIETWEEQGWIMFDSHKKGEIKISYDFYENVQRHECGNSITEVDAPVRVLHGTEDDVLDLMNAAFFYDNAQPPRNIKLIDGAGHMYLDEPYIDTMAEFVVEWCSQHL